MNRGQFVEYVLSDKVIDRISNYIFYIKDLPRNKKNDVKHYIKINVRRHLPMFLYKEQFGLEDVDYLVDYTIKNQIDVIVQNTFTPDYKIKKTKMVAYTKSDSTMLSERAEENQQPSLESNIRRFKSNVSNTDNRRLNTTDRLNELTKL